MVHEIQLRPRCIMESANGSLSVGSGLPVVGVMFLGIRPRAYGSVVS